MTDKEIENFVHWLQGLTAKKFYGSEVEDLIFEHKKQIKVEEQKVCEHIKVEVEMDLMGNTHYCKTCGLWNF